VGKEARSKSVPGMILGRKTIEIVQLNPAIAEMSGTLLTGNNVCASFLKLTMLIRNVTVELHQVKTHAAVSQTTPASIHSRDCSYINPEPADAA